MKKVQENVDYLLLKSSVRKHGKETIAPIIKEHVDILRIYANSNKMIRDMRWRTVRAIKSVGTLTDVNADRDQSNCGPQSLRQAAARLDFARSLLAEACALGASDQPVVVNARNNDRRFGFTPVRVLRPLEFYELLERPVCVSVLGRTVCDTAAHTCGSVERRAAGYLAHLIEAAVRASRQTEILRAMQAAKSGGTGDGNGNESDELEDEISIAVNMLRTVLPRPLLATLRAKLRF